MIVRHTRWYHSPADDCHGALLAALEVARMSIHVLSYAFTLADLAELLLQKHQEGLGVGVVTDRLQSARRTQKALLQRLVDAGVPDVTITTSHGHLMHLKCVLIDHELGAHHNDSVVALGSYNLTPHAQLQANSLTITNDGTLAEYFWTQYCELRDYGRAHYPQLRPARTRTKEGS